MRSNINNRTRSAIRAEYNEFQYCPSYRSYKLSDHWRWEFIAKRSRAAVDPCIPDVVNDVTLASIRYKVRCKTTSRLRYKKMPLTEFMRHRRGKQ
jgi:hypothetical protein